ncbi:NAD(P)/FAD-dependent oxidoreductase [Algoriphagus chordae]|uniref:Glycine/D-amino acid oxidase-like deaminating enzyme n=1 Tax=Algoriphagus chordae TaxID=237019 RepID=A0A2W7QJV8_9BACT|nr:FAD-dependent oxidoreductase [Algoriphagus chordae]PZX47596.1 glycine/D-amino acid oxidase-like deaminating enzyme [Algoriphagus chordae]
MRLRTFESFWLLKNGLLHSYPHLGETLKTEILVIGGGITGALTSHALLEKGYQVSLIDKRDIAQGSTSATTSMLQYEIDVLLIDLADQIGEKAAATCYQAGRDAILSIGKLIKDLKLDCGFEPKESLYFAHSRKAVKKLKQEFEIRKKHNLGVTWLSATAINKTYGIKCFGGILSDTAASLDAYKFTHELIKFNVGRGMKVYDQTDISEFNLDQKKPELFTSDGVKISCDKVIFCSGFETTKMLKENIADLFDTYATVSEQGINVKPAFNKTLFWNSSDPYLYMRMTDDGRLLVGGEDSKFRMPLFQQKIKERKSKKLQNTIKDIIPSIKFIEDFSWGGTFGSTKDGLPYVGKSPEFENALFVLGFGGNGITFSIQAMDIIPAILKGKKSELAEYYRFGR